MKKIIIAGCGFAGISAFYKLSSFKEKLDLDITLINDKGEAHFLPVLPDCLGRNINPNHLVFDLMSLGKKNSFNFIKDKVTSVDLASKTVRTRTLALEYDYLIIASGSETNFYGNNEVKKRAFKLDDASDAAALKKALDEKSYDSYLIAGAGYTGVEVATNLRVYLKKRNIDKRIILVERAPSILGPLPQWMKDYVLNNLKKLNIEVSLNSSIERVEESFDNSMLIWAAGVRTADFIQDLKTEKSTQGRLKVDEYLRVNDSCFAVGDAAYFAYKNNFLRMAVQFAIMEGRCSASNIIRSIKGKRLIKFKPLDLGLIIPMANNKACGKILGINIRGFLPVLAHYFMCIYRSYGWKNKLGFLKDLIIGANEKVV